MSCRWWEILPKVWEKSSPTPVGFSRAWKVRWKEGTGKGSEAGGPLYYLNLCKAFLGSLVLMDGSRIVSPVVPVRSLAGELLHARDKTLKWLIMPIMWTLTYTLGRSINWYKLIGRRFWQHLIILKAYICYDPATALLGVWPTKKKIAQIHEVQEYLLQSCGYIKLKIIHYLPIGD